MSMSYSSRNLEGREKSLQRFFEIVPGFISWSILLGLTALASLRPTWAIVCILAFDLYWLFFLLYTMILLLASHFLLSAERQTDWLTRAQELPDRLKQLHPSADILREGTFRSWISKRVHEQKVRALIESEAPVPAFDAIHQVIIIPILTAGADILIRAIKSLLEQDFPARRMIVILALDERAASRVKETAWELHREHYDRFLGFYLSPLPADAEEESSGKGANITYAAKMAAQVLEQKNIPEKNVIVTCLDAESILHPHYLACLAYHFMISPKRERAGFQPIPVYHSSAWDAPPVSCMLEIASSLFSLVEATDPVKLISLSSHSMSFSALRATDFWPGDMT